MQRAPGGQIASYTHSRHPLEPIPSSLKGVGTDIRLLRFRQDWKHTTLLNCSVIFTRLGGTYSSITSGSNTASEDSVSKQII